MVPLLGSLYNWWSPTPHAHTHGLTFDLTSGQMVATETVYKRQLSHSSEAVTDSAAAGERKNSLMAPETEKLDDSAPVPVVESPVGDTVPLLG